MKRIVKIYIILLTAVLAVACTDGQQLQEPARQPELLNGVPVEFNVTVADGANPARATEFSWPDGATVCITYAYSESYPYYFYIVYREGKGWLAYNMPSSFSTGLVKKEAVYIPQFTLDDYLGRADKAFTAEAKDALYYKANSINLRTSNGINIIEAEMGGVSRVRFVSATEPTDTITHNAGKTRFSIGYDGSLSVRSVASSDTLHFAKAADGKYYSEYLYTSAVPNLSIDGKPYAYKGTADMPSAASSWCISVPTKNQDTATWSPYVDLTFTVNGVQFVMKYVTGGSFKMGSNASNAESNEQPVHNVSVTDFHIGETEVTQHLWLAVKGTLPSSHDGNLQYPVENVSWNDIQDFITELNQQTGANFRLPFETEWEFAARGGNKSKGYKYSGSNTLGNVAWYSGNSAGSVHVVKSKAPNELGIYDMSGNVWEWCHDWYGKYPNHNPSSGTSKVKRGGSWYHGSSYCRTTYRSYSDPSSNGNLLGFRLAL